LEWSLHAGEASNGRSLILTPLAVARQIEAEGLRWGYPAKVIRDQSEAVDGINVCNYDRLSLLDPDAFGAVVLDESSIIKNFTGKTSRALIAAFANHRWRLSASATPAPNDHQELGTQSEFLGVMPMNDMLIRWFINDTADTGTWRLKGHARDSYWDWMSSWCRMADHPRDLGDELSTGYDLPELRVVHHRADASDLKLDGTLFAADVSATGIHDLKRQTAEQRAKSAALILEGREKPFIVWVDTDYESDAVRKALLPIFGHRLVEVRGSMSIEAKEDAIQRFGTGDALGILTKSSITGFGLNWQHCDTMVFVGRSFSYESWHQAVRRCWRFGQKNPVTVHVVVAEGEDSIGRVLDRKSEDHDHMKKEMAAAMRRAIGLSSSVKRHYEPNHQGRLPQWFVA
jgi:superfamily II DNA or RNA helicase